MDALRQDELPLQGRPPDPARALHPIGDTPRAAYRLQVTATAARALGNRLPELVAAAVLEFLHGDLLLAPRRVGHELQRELSGTWSARRGSYRILYEIHDAETDSGHSAPGSVELGVVLVVDVDHRADVYRRR